MQVNTVGLVRQLATALQCSISHQRRMCSSNSREHGPDDDGDAVVGHFERCRMYEMRQEGGSMLAAPGIQKWWEPDG